MQQEPKTPSSLSEISAVVHRLVARIDSIEAGAQPELFRRHLRSVRALLLSEEARASVYAGGKTDLSKQTLEILGALQRGFDADAADWSTYTSGHRSLVMSYISKRDHTVEHYWLTLPKGYESGRAFPLYFELHGASDTHPLGWGSGQLGLPAGVKASDYERPTMVPMVERKGFHVYPFGRGNSGYDDIGETDVWEALADVEQTVKLDPDRYYIYGFSMGGGGTWKLATRTPDKWAAAAILSPSLRNIDRDVRIGLAKNVEHLPFFIWCGATDGLVANARIMKDELTKVHQAPEYVEIPNMGHMFTQEAQRQVANFFADKVRKRPDHFSFIADTPDHLGAWGIRLERDPLINFAPHFEVEIKNQTVEIRSKGTKHVSVDLVSLGMKDEITVNWNGKRAYKGEAKPIVLGN